jgi:positive regulator of sigma E activity
MAFVLVLLPLCTLCIYTILCCVSRLASIFLNIFFFHLYWIILRRYDTLFKYRQKETTFAEESTICGYLIIYKCYDVMCYVD